MYYKGKGDNIGRLIVLMGLQKEMRYLGYHNLGLKNFNALREEVDEEVEMLKRGDRSHV